MPKDIHRFSHSRVSCFKNCARKHHYIYSEDIETPESAYTIPGKLFHECVEKTLNAEDCTPVYEEFRKLSMAGKIDLDPDILEYIVNLYFSYYADEHNDEETVLVEKEYTEKLEDDDYIVVRIDKAFRKFGELYIRDTKTTEKPLKYTQDDVTYNNQLLLYTPFVEEDIKEKVSCIQIDEVRIARLQPIPIRKDGTPTTDKNKLGLCTYEDYYDLLSQMGKAGDAEYQPTLDYLRQRGHPLFRRITAQLLDDNIVSTNAQEFLDAYHTARTDPTYRVKGPLCAYCQYQELCKLDYFNPDTPSREAIINKIKQG